MITGLIEMLPVWLSILKRHLNLGEICKSLDQKILTKSEAFPVWIW